MRRLTGTFGRNTSKRAPSIVFLGRLAVFPSTLVAAAAGTSGMGLRAFLVADGAGGVLSMVVVIGAGYLLGSASESAGPWLAALGVITLAAMGIVLGRQLRRTVTCRLSLPINRAGRRPPTGGRTW